MPVLRPIMPATVWIHLANRAYIGEPYSRERCENVCIVSERSAKCMRSISKGLGCLLCSQCYGLVRQSSFSCNVKFWFVESVMCMYWVSAACHTAQRSSRLSSSFWLIFRAPCDFWRRGHGFGRWVMLRSVRTSGPSAGACPCAYGHNRVELCVTTSPKHGRVLVLLFLLFYTANTC